jgi:diguanylate cyclase (GGDEF)-like protein
MASLETLPAAHATLLVGSLQECFIALGWLLAAALLPAVRGAALHWAGFAFLQSMAFFLYINSLRWIDFPVHAVADTLLAAALVLQVRGLQRVMGRQPADGVFIALLVFAGLAQWVWAAQEQSAWRMAAASLLSSGISAWSAATMLRCVRQENAHAPRLLGLVLSAPSVIGSMLFAMRAWMALQHPEQVIRDDRLDQTIGVPGSLAWLFLSLSTALALVGLALYKLQRKLSRAATHDALTGLPNRRAADHFLAHEALRAQRQGTPLSALMVDIDFFKKVNDQHGHAGGDHVLQHMAQLLQERARATDLVARWGGEEFLVLLPDTSAAGAHKMAEQLRLAVQNTPFLWQQHTVPITVSIGAATCTGLKGLYAVLCGT